MNTWIWIVIIGLPVLILILTSIKIVRPTQRGLIERLGKYARFAEPGPHLIIPFGIEKMIKVEVTEILAEAKPQEIITLDKLNAIVDAQVYYKIKSDEQGVKDSQYNVQDCAWQIENLARTTLRNIIGTMKLNDANSGRTKINEELMGTLTKETQNWGIYIVRTELKEINPPKLVQETMNSVVIAENQKQAAVDFATAAETKADGLRRAAIKEAEGKKQATVLIAQGDAEAIKLVSEELKKEKLYLEFQKIQKWNGILPQVTGGATPMINFNGGDSGKGN